VLGQAPSSTSNLGVNPLLKPLRFHEFLPVSPKPSSLSSSKIGRDIFGFGKNLFWELVPCVEVTLVSKFHLIWCPISQESRLKRKGQILGENHVSRDLRPDKVWLYQTKFKIPGHCLALPQTLSDLGFQPDVRALLWPQFAIRVSD
jgi:hypothetical protein